MAGIAKNKYAAFSDENLSGRTQQLYFNQLKKRIILIMES